MSSDAPKVVAVGYVGGQERVDSELHTIRAVFRNFAALPHERGRGTKSPVLECHGYEWQVQIFPGGNASSNEVTPHVSLFLNCVSAATGNAKVNARYKFRIPSVAGVFSSHKRLFPTQNGHSGWGKKDFRPRADILDPAQRFLVDGDLTVEVDIQVLLDKPPKWTPSNTVCADMLNMFETADDETSDVTFQLDDVQLYAHSNILKARCPTLAALAEDYDKNTPIPIDAVDPDVFLKLLRFVYGGEIPKQDDLVANARTLISASDRFGCTGLKLAAEAELASAGISVENAADLILFADGTNCAMLKEAAMDFFVSNSEAVMESEGYSRVKESPAILHEIVTAALRNKKRPAPSGPDDRDYKRMRVATLRQRLDSKGLDVDGSREMLITRLEANDTIETNAEVAESVEDDEESDSD